MPSLIEIPKRVPMPQCTRTEAAQLLGALRAAYQSLSFAERSLVKSLMASEERVHFMQDQHEEKECFVSVL